MLKEGVEVLKALWNQHQEDNGASPSTYSSIRYDGKFFRINGASPIKSDTGVRFTKTKIPITISAKKRLMLRLAAKFADIWEASYLSPQEFKVLNFQFERINQELDNEVNNYNFRNDRNRTGTSKSIEIDVIIAASDTELESKKKLFKFFVFNSLALSDTINNTTIVAYPNNLVFADSIIE